MYNVYNELKPWKKHSVLSSYMSAVFMSTHSKVHRVSSTCRMELS